jgi:hypothetical protein
VNSEASARISGEVTSKEELEKRMEAVAWGLILMVTGAALALPGWTIPVGGWLAAMGVILLGLNLVRHWNGIETAQCTTILGIAALAGAAGMFLGLGLLVFPILMVLAGGWVVLRQFAQGRARATDGGDEGQ